ncbi:aspartate kinase [Arthrobacter sp. VKM Ac-2550]|uniref:aspartate kinase n=1 Tax=Crystallibacter permensis TaxID=1938888 RepID=UPI002227DACA|nr:aspartate kinase [Arthrobacter sp. VKM Ac-2550]MCW2131473.1 aspartate kinase [Arthrobacter sp. VKM Ac-2550]
MNNFKRLDEAIVRMANDAFAQQHSAPTIDGPLPLDILPPAVGTAGHSKNVIVQKYGGSSVADAAGIRRVAQRVAETQASGHQVVAVVSAMGDATDDLLDLAASVSPHPPARELDTLLTTGELVSAALLAIALADLGADVRTFTGSAAGLITDDFHGKARIVDVDPRRIRACLKNGQIAVVAGFQGRSRKGKTVTTLGRGGSDLTAVALAAALGASVCEVYTDVDGIYTADPRIVPNARKIDVLASEEMLEFAASGAKVLHLRCIEYARRFGVPIHVRSSFAQKQGTMILPSLDQHHSEAQAGEQTLVSNVASVNSAAQVTVAGIPDCSRTAARLLQDLAAAGLSIEMLAQNPRDASTELADITFTLPSAEVPAAIAALDAAQSRIGFEALHHNDEVGKVSLTGLGMRSSPTAFSTFFQALADAGISPEIISISELCIAAVTPANQLADAVRALQIAFGLTPPEEEVAADPHARHTSPVRVQAAASTGQREFP